MVALVGYLVYDHYRYHSSHTGQLNLSPPDLANQGAFIPLVGGRRRVGAVIAWAGSRYARNENTTSSGGFGKGSRKKKQGGQTVFYEAGWHQICVGPASQLHRIWQDGKVIWTGPIDSVSDPSGSSFTAYDGSAFTIYWGEPDQPVDAVLADAGRVGIASRWPHLCYVVWTNKRLGGSARWPQIEYDIETQVYVNALGDAPYGLTVADTEIVGPPAGPNAAFLMGQVLFESYPHGLGLDPALFSIGEQGEGGFVVGSLADLATLILAEGQVGSIFADGTPADGTLNDLMQDMGCMMHRDYANAGLNSWTPIRLATATALPDNMILPTETESEVSYGERDVDKMMYSFKDVDRQFKQSVLALDSDGNASLVNNVKTQNTELNTIIHQEIASKVAERRSQEVADPAKFTIFAGRGARKLSPGMVISVTDLPIAVRLTDVKIDPDDDKVELNCFADYYGAEPSTQAQPVVVSPGGDTAAPADNLEQDFLEMPALAGDGRVPYVVPLRIRDNQTMTQQIVYLSPDGVSYREVLRDSTIQSGGVLTEGMTADDWQIEDGPTIDVEGDDIADVIEDFSADEISWRSGRQCVLIGTELFFLRNVTALGGVSYRLNGLVRACYETERAVHSIGDPVFIFSSDAMEPFYDFLLTPGATLYMKQQAQGNNGTVALGTVTATTHVLEGRGLAPMRPGPIYLSAPRLCQNEYSTGEDIQLEWTYRSLGVPNTGAGLVANDAAYGVSPVDGEFEIKFYSLAMVLKATYLASANTFPYTNAMLVADFGGEESFVVEIRNINGGLESAAVSRTVVLV